jgi:PAS domain S-box-containing protein
MFNSFDMKAMKTDFSCTIDELPMPVIIYRQQDGQVLKYNKVAKKLFGIPGYTKPFAISNLRPEKLHSKLKSATDFGPRIYRSFKGKEISTRVVRKSVLWNNVNCFVEFLENSEKEVSSKNEIINASLDAFISITEDQVILDWNSSAEKIFGWKRKEAIGRQLVETIIPAQHRKRHIKGFRYDQKTGKGQILNKLIETTALHKKGHEFPIELTITPVKKHGESIFYAFIRDISERKETENSLRESKYKLNRAQAIASVGSWEMYGNFRELYWSDEFYRIHGLKPQSVKPSTRLRLSLVYPKDRAKLQHAIDEAARIGTPFSFEHRIVRHDDKKIRWLLSQGEATTDMQTGKRKVFGTVLDITERKENEERQATLTQSLADFQNAIQSSSIVSRANNSGIITYVNDNFAKISGYSEKELIGKDHRVLNSRHHPKSFWTDMWKTISSGKTWRADVKNKAKDGTYYWVDTFIMPFLNEKGRVQEFLSIRNEITARKKFEEEIESSNAKLSETLIFGKMGSAEMDLRTFQLTVSRELLRLLDIEASEPQTMPIEQFLKTYIPPDFLTLIQQRIQEGMRTKRELRKMVSAEFEMISATGRKLWIEAIGIFKGGTALGILHEVTERRKAQEELLNANELLKRLADNIPGFIYRFRMRKDGSTHFPYASKGIQDIYGLHPDEVAEDASPLFARVHPDDIERITKEVQHSSETLRARPVEFRIMKKDGKMTWLKTNAAIELQADGGLLWYGYTFDITDQKKAEHALKESENDLRTMLHETKQLARRLELANKAARLGVWQIDFVGNKWKCDEQLREILGIEDEVITKEKYQTLIHPDEIVRKKIRDQLLLQSQDIHYENEYRIIRPSDGEVRYIKSQGLIFRDENGNPVSGISVLYDQTKEKLAEKRILQALQEKETLIKEVHHRIKNNLQLISSIVYLKLATFNQPDIREFLEGLRQKIKSIAVLHERLLQTEELDAVNIHEYLNKVIKDIQVSFYRPDLLVETKTEIADVHLPSDVATYCGLIVNELVTNAVKHAFPLTGKGEISVSLWKENNGKLVLSVRDNGTGLPERISPQDTGNFGMSLIYIFVKQLRGEIEIVRNNGTNFLVRFDTTVTSA